MQFKNLQKKEKKLEISHNQKDEEITNKMFQ